MGAGGAGPPSTFRTAAGTAIVQTFQPLAPAIALADARTAGIIQPGEALAVDVDLVALM